MDRNTEADVDSNGVDRRGFLGLVAVLLSAAVGIAGAVVAGLFTTAPALTRSEDVGQADGEWSPIPEADLADASEPTRHSVAVVERSGWAVSTSTYAVFLDTKADGEPVAYSARCPHEGCQVDWSADTDGYVCPCHNSSWTRAGDLKTGPAKRGLDPLPVQKRDKGGVEVKYALFALDTDERIELG